MRFSSNQFAARRFRAAWALVLMLLSISGCGGNSQKSEVELFTATGKVTVDGEPLAEANMEFVPVGDTRGQGGVAITDFEGNYSAETPYGETGLPAGEYQVVISKLELPKGVHFDVPPDKNLPPADSPYRESLPPHYSDRGRTKLKMKMPAKAASKKDFTLTLKSSR